MSIKKVEYFLVIKLEGFPNVKLPMSRELAENLLHDLGAELMDQDMVEKGIESYEDYFKLGAGLARLQKSTIDNIKEETEMNRTNPENYMKRILSVDAVRICAEAFNATLVVQDGEHHRNGREIWGDVHSVRLFDIVAKNAPDAIRIAKERFGEVDEDLTEE